MDNNQNNHIKGQYAIVERRRRVADLLAQSFREDEIVEQLGVGRTTVIRDVHFLKEAAQKFVFDLARSSLAFFYRVCILGVEAVSAELGILLTNLMLMKR
jgi:hypothetical protein